MVFETRVVRVGSSRAVIIPMTIAKGFGWDVGSEISMEVVASAERGEIKLTRAVARKARSKKEMTR